jgi:tetratricopeptide (TPR) repeat protein
VQLQCKDPDRTLDSRTDAYGAYSFSSLPRGVYVLSAAMGGYNAARISSVFLSPNEAKKVDLTLEPSKKSAVDAIPPAANASGQPQFFDEPQFTVAGVTDTTSLGGHGSDTVVRTRENIAKDTASLGKATAEPAVGQSANEIELRARAESLRKLLAAHESAELHHSLASVEERRNNPLEAVREYQRAAEMDPSEPYLFDWGSELLLHHAAEPALEVFAKGVRLFPHSTRMSVGRGAAWFASGSYERAVRQICEASDLSPADPTPYIFLGKMQRAEATSSNDVAERLRRFTQLQPASAEAKYYYAVSLWKLPRDLQGSGREGQVESLLKDAVRLDANLAAAHFQLGIVHAASGNDSAAISDFQAAVRSDPQMEEAHYRLAQTYRKLGQADKAKDELRLYEELGKASAQRVDRERHDIRQFVYTLRDQPAGDAR